MKTVYNAEKIVSVHYIKSEINDRYCYDKNINMFVDMYVVDNYIKYHTNEDIKSCAKRNSYSKDDFGINKKFGDLFIDENNNVCTLSKVEVYFDNQESYTIKFDDHKEAYLYFNKISSKIPNHKQIEVDI